MFDLFLQVAQKFFALNFFFLALVLVYRLLKVLFGVGAILCFFNGVGYYRLLKVSFEIGAILCFFNEVG